MTTWSSRKQALQLSDAFGNITAVGAAHPSGGLVLNSVLPQMLYGSVSPRAAGTNPLIPLRDPEISVLRAKVADLERQLGEKFAALENQVAELRQDFKARQSVRTVALSSLASERYRLRQPLWAELDSSGEAVTAHIPELEEYGTGATEYEALEDLRLVLLETYVFLQDNEAKLGPAPASQLRRFRDLVENS